MANFEAIKEAVLSRKITLSEAVYLYERELILDVLRVFDGHQGKAAAFLKVHRNTLRNKLKRGRYAQIKVQNDQ